MKTILIIFILSLFILFLYDVFFGKANIDPKAIQDAMKAIGEVQKISDQ